MMTGNFNRQRLQIMSDFSHISILKTTLCRGVKEKGIFGHCDKTAKALLRSGLIFSWCLAWWPMTPLLSDSCWLTELLSGTLGLTVCVCQCSCVCMACRSSFLSPLALPFAPMFLFAPVPLSDPVPLSQPHSQSSHRSWSSPPFFPSRLLSRRLSLPLLRPRHPPLLSRHLSLPASFSLRMNAPAAACGVNCHKACRGRLAVECRKRTKSISHEAPPSLQARSYSFPPPANTPPSLQNTGEGCFGH